MMPAALKTITTDPAFTSSDAISFPNRIFGGTKDGKRIGALVAVRRSRRGGKDFALNKVGLDYLDKALRDGRIDEGYVALFQDGGEFVAAEQAQVVQTA